MEAKRDERGRREGTQRILQRVEGGVKAFRLIGKAAVAAIVALAMLMEASARARPSGSYQLRCWVSLLESPCLAFNRTVILRG